MVLSFAIIFAGSVVVGVGFGRLVTLFLQGPV